MTIRLATDGQTVFAQQGSGASAKYFRFDGTTCANLGQPLAFEIMRVAILTGGIAQWNVQYATLDMPRTFDNFVDQEIKANQLNLIQLKNNLMPDLRFNATYDVNSIGTRSVRASGSRSIVSTARQAMRTV